MGDDQETPPHIKSRSDEYLLHAVLAVAGFAVAIWAHARIPEVAVKIPRIGEPLTPAWSGFSAWSIGLCVGVVGALGFLVTVAPTLGRRLARFRVASTAVVLLVLFLILWWGRIG